MERSDPFYREFLTELKALDDFLVRRGAELEYVERADPDVRRLMEAMAFFSARSRKLAVDGFGGAVQRLARGHTDELLRAQPARALIHAVPGDRLAEPVTLPAGTQVRVAAGDDATGLFTTMRRATLRPLAVHSARLGLRPGSGFRLLIELRSRAPVHALDDPLSVYIDYLGDYRASRQLLYQLEQHLVAASVVFGGDEPDPGAGGLRCEVSFGALPRGDSDAHPHPLAELGAFFHFPEKDLFFHAALPGSEQPWRRAWLCLDLDPDWPTQTVVNKDVFKLFVIPVENARKDLAEPIVCDGTRDSYELRPPAPHTRDVLHAVIGVYEEVKSGWQALLPEHLSPVLPEDQGTYEVEPADPGGAARLMVRIPDAFDKPRKIAVEARWYQPWFDARAVGRLDVSLQTRRVEGVKWELLGTVRGHRPSRLAGKPFEVLHVLALMGKPVLARDELLYVMQLVGADEDSHHGEAAGLVDALRVTEQRVRPSGGLAYVYRVGLGKVADEVAALVWDFLARMRDVLDAWSGHPVEVHAEDTSARGAGRVAG